MGIKINYKLKYIFLVFAIFILLSFVISPNAFATGETEVVASQSEGITSESEFVPDTSNFEFKTKFGATGAMLVITTIQIAGSAFWVIRLTILGIQYFFGASLSSTGKELATLKNQLTNNIFYAVIWFLIVFLSSMALGL